MRGAIRAKEKCDRCGGSWRDEYARGRHVGIACDSCGAPAPAVYIDARGFRDRTGNVGKIYTDDHGQPLHFPAAISGPCSRVPPPARRGRGSP
jgi:hypothetical protein